MKLSIKFYHEIIYKMRSYQLSTIIGIFLVKFTDAARSRYYFPFPGRVFVPGKIKIIVMFNPSNLNDYQYWFLKYSLQQEKTL